MVSDALTAGATTHVGGAFWAEFTLNDSGAPQALTGRKLLSVAVLVMGTPAAPVV